MRLAMGLGKLELLDGMSAGLTQNLRFSEWPKYELIAMMMTTVTQSCK